MGCRRSPWWTASSSPAISSHKLGDSRKSPNPTPRKRLRSHHGSRRHSLRCLFAVFAITAIDNSANQDLAAGEKFGYLLLKMVQ
ncbi:hypothetical protein PIB30_042018 [Stylosanthes scabra]|uniref:Uncharacterized protein n=1 Tax=Stylosanthes scabra TaxID=79078 RepID=A0ABU6TEP8_9FABA|nr:hypothetical protein [Stylosanthes scabra]